MLGHNLEVVGVLHDVDEVDGPVSSHLVRDVHAVDGLRVPGLGDHVE